MGTRIVLLRGINIGSRNRIAMGELRDALTKAGFGDVRTYLQSGNVVVSSDATVEAIARECESLIEQQLGLAIDVVARTREQLADVVGRDPLGAVASNPKRYQVSFLDEELGPEVLEQIEQAAVAPEQVVVSGREVFAWHPEGVARSPLWALLASRKLGVRSTARNWTTVNSLLELAEELERQ
jgi:uncharacterized protein (DUF1697 family)